MEPSHTYSGSGTYSVTLTATCGTRTSTVVKHVVIVLPSSPLKCYFGYGTVHNGDTRYLGSLPYYSQWTQTFFIQLDGSNQNTISGVTVINPSAVSSLEFLDGASNPVVFPFILGTSYPNYVMVMNFIPVLSGDSGFADFVFINSGTQFVLNMTWDISYGS